MMFHLFQRVVTVYRLINTLKESLSEAAEQHRCAQLCVLLTTGHWLSLCVYSQPQMLVGCDCTSVR